MALKKDFEMASGVLAVDAYHKIVEIKVTSLGADDSASLQVNTYASAARAISHPKTPAATRWYKLESFDLDAVMNATTAAYGFLKSLDDFADAVDV